MFKSKMQASSLLIVGIFAIIIGIMCINAPYYFLVALYYGVSIIFTLGGLSTTITAFLSNENKAKRSAKLINGIGQLAIGIIVFLNPLNILNVLAYLFGAFGLIMSIIGFINYYVYLSDKLSGKLLILLEAIIYLVFSLLLFLRPFIENRWLFKIIGFYLVFYGLVNLQGFLKTLYPKLNKHKYKMTLPIFMNALLPQKLIKYINRQIKESGANSQELKAIRDKDTPYDMEILIHLGDKGFDSVGHVDVAFRDIILSYGCHDHHKTKLGGALGPGIIHFAQKSAYIKFACLNRDKNLIGFGIHLEDSEKQNILKTLNEMSSRFIDWYSDYDLKESQLPYSGDCNNYASLLSKHVQSKFYKFTKGKFKTYFVMTTNCCLLADTIVGKSGLDLIKIGGIVTPGAYYEYLNSEFLLPNTRVVSRNIYMKENINELKNDFQQVKTIHDIEDPSAFIKSNIFS